MRKSIYIDGFNHGSNPVPAASLCANVLVTGAIFGMDPSTLKVAPGFEKQCEYMFLHASNILREAGCTWEQVAKMTFYIAPDQARNLINDYWVQLFPDANSRPARHVMVNDKLPPGMLIQCDLMAVAHS